MKVWGSKVFLKVYSNLFWQFRNFDSRSNMFFTNFSHSAFGFLIFELLIWRPLSSFDGQTNFLLFPQNGEKMTFESFQSFRKIPDRLNWILELSYLLLEKSFLIFACCLMFLKYIRPFQSYLLRNFSRKIFPSLFFHSIEWIVQKMIIIFMNHKTNWRGLILSLNHTPVAIYLTFTRPLRRKLRMRSFPRWRT